MSESFDFSDLGKFMGPHDLRGPITYETYGSAQDRMDQRLVADRDNRVIQRPATDLEKALLRYRSLVPPEDPDKPDQIRAILTWHGPVRELQFLRNNKLVVEEEPNA